MVAPTYLIVSHIITRALLSELVLSWICQNRYCELIWQSEHGQHPQWVVRVYQYVCQCICQCRSHPCIWDADTSLWHADTVPHHADTVLSYHMFMSRHFHNPVFFMHSSVLLHHTPLGGTHYLIPAAATTYQSLLDTSQPLSHTSCRIHVMLSSVHFTVAGCVCSSSRKWHKVEKERQRR